MCQKSIIRWPLRSILCSDTAVSYISQWGIGAGKWLRSIRRCVVRIGPTGKPKTSTGRWGRPASVQLGFVWVGWILVPFFNYRNRLGTFTPSLKIRHFNPISVLPAVTLTFDLCSWHWACTWGHRWTCYIPDFIILGGLQVCQVCIISWPDFPVCWHCCWLYLTMGNWRWRMASQHQALCPP